MVNGYKRRNRRKDGSKKGSVVDAALLKAVTLLINHTVP